MHMSHCVDKKAPLNVSPHPSPLTDFHQVWLLFYKKYFINLLLLIRLLQKIMHFQSKTIFFQLIVGRSTIMKLRINNLCIDRFLFGLSSNHVALPKNSWLWFENYMLLLFFSVFEEAKFEVGTSSIILSYI